MTQEKSYTVHDILTVGYTLEPLVCLACGSHEVTFDSGLFDAHCANCDTWQVDYTPASDNQETVTIRATWYEWQRMEGEITITKERLDALRVSEDYENDVVNLICEESDTHCRDGGIDEDAEITIEIT